MPDSHPRLDARRQNSSHIVTYLTEMNRFGKMGVASRVPILYIENPEFRSRTVY